jgi:putative acetyltransferase
MSDTVRFCGDEAPEIGLPAWRNCAYRRRVMPDLLLRAEQPRDRDAIRRVHQEAFGDGGTVAALADALRAAPAPLAPLSFVAAVGGEVAGNVMLTASRLDALARLVDVYVLSPLSVLPGFQRQGIGAALIKTALRAAEERRVPLVFLEGDPAYYGKRGFERADAHGFRAPSLRIPPPGFQVARLPGHEPWMTGTLVYSDIFWAHDCVGLRGAELEAWFPE